jgi:Ser-tRNA(Ala) deacylase AlaX
MGDEALRYSRHATHGMIAGGLFEDDVEGTIDWPTRRYRNPDDTIEHLGYASDGRLINVVTDLSERRVITVIDVDKRSRDRQKHRHSRRHMQ